MSANSDSTCSGGTLTSHTRTLHVTEAPATFPHQLDEPTVSPPVLLVNVARAAEILCLSRSSIYHQLIWSEQSLPIRIGRSVRFWVEQLEQFVADRATDR